MSALFMKIVPVRERPLFFWIETPRCEGLVTGVTPLGFLAVRCTDGRLRFVLPTELA